MSEIKGTITFNSSGAKDMNKPREGYQKVGAITRLSKLVNDPKLSDNDTITCTRYFAIVDHEINVAIEEMKMKTNTTTRTPEVPPEDLVYSIKKYMYRETLNENETQSIEPKAENTQDINVSKAKDDDEGREH